MHMDLTRSTTSRHAPIVKRTFNRARDPQRMWISRDYHKMRYGQKHVCVKSNFCGKRCYSKQQNFLRRSNKSHFSRKKGFQKTNSKNDERTLFLFRCQRTEIQKIYSWKGLNKCFGVKKKGLFILIEKTRLKKKEKEWNKKRWSDKKNLQKGMNTWKKFGFSRKKRRFFFKKKGFAPRKNRRNIRESQ